MDPQPSADMAHVVAHQVLKSAAQAITAGIKSYSDVPSHACVGSSAAAAAAAAYQRSHSGQHRRSRSASVLPDPLSCISSNSPATASTSGGGGLDHCGAPGFMTAMLICLKHKGRLPEELAMRWGQCPKAVAFGFTFGPAFAEQLLQLKLQLNTSAYSGLAKAAPAAALVILDDWFRSFTAESLTDTTLEVLMDESEELLAQSCSSSSSSTTANQEHAAHAAAVCNALTHNELELFLVLAATLRIARASQISMEQQQSNSGSSSSNNNTTANLDAPVSSAGASKVVHLPPITTLARASSSAAASSLKTKQGTDTTHAPPAQGISTQKSLVKRSNSHGGSSTATAANGASSTSPGNDVAGDCIQLCHVMAGWLLGPLADACNAAVEVIETFLWYLVHDDVGYR